MRQEEGEVEKDNEEYEDEMHVSPGHFNKSFVSEGND